MSNQIAWGQTRPTVGGMHGVVASAHPLASQAGLDILRQGGNAVDAIVATAAALNVVEPYMSGIGGVGFLLLHLASAQARTLNFSGAAPAKATPDQFTHETRERGPRSCVIPGNLAGWTEAHRCHGLLSLAQVFSPAVAHAREGFPLHPANARLLALSLERLDEEGLRIYGAVKPRIGAVLRQPELADTLEAIAADGGKDFYRGRLGRDIAEHVQSLGGLLAPEDLASYRPEWEDPISVDYRGLEVRTCPPNSEGFQILQTLLLLEPEDLKGLGHNTAAYLHLLSEAIKLAMADRISWGSDPRQQPVPLERLLSPDYIAARRRLIQYQQASQSNGETWVPEGIPGAVAAGSENGLTTHMSVVDSGGNACSITQSLGSGFGSGIVIPGTGIALNNFANWSEIDPRCPNPNLIAPGQRASCCMAPLQVFKEGRFWFSVGTPGSWGIPQTTAQMILNIVEFGANPQLAIEAPRIRLQEGTRVLMEDRVDEGVRTELASRGHNLELIGDFSWIVGGGQSVMIDPDSGARLGGADPRRDGYALAY